MMDKETFDKFISDMKPVRLEIDAYHARPHGFSMEKLVAMQNYLHTEHKTLLPVIVAVKYKMMEVKSELTGKVRTRRVPIEYVAMTGCHRWVAYFTEGHQHISAILVNYNTWHNDLTRGQRAEAVHYVESNTDFIYDRGTSEYWKYAPVHRKIKVEDFLD